MATNLLQIVDSQSEIATICDEIKEMLLEKNRKYGDSALNPSRTFASSDSIEQIKVRIDDKLNRIKNAQSDEDEDVLMDLMGYLVLLRIAIRRQKGTTVPLQEAQDEAVPEWVWTPPMYPPAPYWPTLPPLSPTYPPGWQMPTSYNINTYDDGHHVQVDSVPSE